MEIHKIKKEGKYNERWKYIKPKYQLNLYLKKEEERRRGGSRGRRGKMKKEEDLRN